MLSLQLKFADFGETACSIEHKVGEAVGGLSALNAMCFFSSGFIGLDDMAMDMLGAFSVVGGLSDMLAMVGEGCGEGRGSVLVVTLAVVGPELFLVIIGLSNVSTVVGRALCCCGGSRGLVCAATSNVVGPGLSLGCRVTSSNFSSSYYIFALLYFYTTLFPLRLLNSLLQRTHGYTCSHYLDSFPYL